MKLEKWTEYIKKFMGPISDRAIPCLPYLPWLERCDRVLDIGCGTGRIVEFLRLQKMINAVGTTINPLEFKEGVSILADMHDLPFHNEEFDGVIAWDSLEHAVAPYIVLTEIFRVLKSGGKFLCFIPGEDWIDCDYHCLVLTLEQMKHLCKLVGFTSFETMKDETRGATKGGTIYKVIK